MSPGLLSGDYLQRTRMRCVPPVVRRGDRVVIVAGNSIETLVVFLATSWLGAMFSSSSTDMGVQGICKGQSRSTLRYADTRFGIPKIPNSDRNSTFSWMTLRYIMANG